MGGSSHIISLECKIRSTLLVSFVILHVDVSFVIKGMKNFEWVVFPLCNNKAPMQLEATFKTIKIFDLRAIEKVLQVKIFLVPLYP